MNNDNVKKTLAMWGNVESHYGYSENKVHAINRDMEYAKDFDIVLLLSDDMMPVEKGFDRIICDHFKKHFPNLDGVLWMNDGFTGRKLNTIVCMGRVYYERFGFLYNPAYKSLFCDNEFTDISARLNKYFYLDRVIIQHQHPMNMRHVKSDNLYRRNDSFFHADRQTYEKRKKLLEKELV
jgi:hypothetical protein